MKDKPEQKENIPKKENASSTSSSSSSFSSIKGCLMVEAVTDAEILWIHDVTPNNYYQNFTEITLNFLLLCSKIA